MLDYTKVDVREGITNLTLQKYTTCRDIKMTLIYSYKLISNTEGRFSRTHQAVYHFH